MRIKDKILSPIILDELLIFGFRLYPRASFKIHRVFTAFFGRNGTGKTTILDAVQIALIANQKYIRLNPTAQKEEERTLDDYLGSDVGYIVLALRGHERIKNLGIRLEKRFDGRVMFQPFVVENVPLKQDDFLEGNVLRNDLPSIARSLRMRDDGTGNIRSFENTKDYHRALFQEGILPFDLSSPKVLREFATIFTAVSTGLSEKTKLLKDVLCPARKRTANFLHQLEENFARRQDVKRRIQDLQKAREEITNLQNYLEETENTGLKFFGSALFRARSELKRIATELNGWRQKQDAATSALKRLGEHLAGLEQAKAKATEEQEKLLMNLREQQKLVRARKRYQTLGLQLKDLDSKQTELEQTFQRIIKDYENSFNDLQRYEHKESELQKERYILQKKLEEKKQFLAQANKLDQARKKMEAELGREFNTFEELSREAENLSAINRFARQRDTLLQLIAEKKTRLSKQQQAINLVRELEMMGLNEFSDSALQRVKEQLNEQQQRINLEKQKLEQQIQKNRTLLHNLQNYQADLPDVFKNSKGRYLFEQYEDVSWEEAARLEMILGPLTTARIIQSEDEAYALCRGRQRLYFISDSENLEAKNDVLECAQGVLVREGKVLRYEPRPEAPILGKKARQKRIENLTQEVSKLIETDRQLTGELTSIEDKRQRIDKLLPLLEYLQDENLEAEILALQKRLDEFEENLRIAARLKGELSVIRQSSALHFDVQQLSKQAEVLEQDLKRIANKHDEYINKIQHLKNKVQKSSVEKQQIEKAKTELITEMSELKGQIKALMQEYPLSVLEQEIGEEEEQLQDELDKSKARVQELDRQIRRVEREIVTNEHFIQEAQQHRKLLQEEEEKWKTKEQELKEEVKFYFENIDPPLQDTGTSRVDFENKLVLLKREMSAFASEHGQNMPSQTVLKRWLEELISLVYPEYANFDKLKETLSLLETELGKIEHSIRQVVGNFKNEVYEQVAKIERKVRKVNARMEHLRFGRVRQVKLQVLRREAYHKLNNLAASNTLLRFMQNTQMSFEEFIKAMARELGYLRTDPTYEEIVDYRYYIDLDFTVVDEHNKERKTGLSNGESLGVNLAIITALFENMAQDDTGERFKTGLAVLILDEADRLDHTAIETVYNLMEQSGIQMLTALPNVPLFRQGFLYQLLPTPEGLVWVSSAID